MISDEKQAGGATMLPVRDAYAESGPPPDETARFAVWQQAYATAAQRDGWGIQVGSDGRYGLWPLGGPYGLTRFDKVSEHVVRQALAGSPGHRAALAVIDATELGFISRFTMWNAGVRPGQFSAGDPVQVWTRTGWVDAVIAGSSDIGYVIEGSRGEACWWNAVRVPVVETEGAAA